MSPLHRPTAARLAARLALAGTFAGALASPALAQTAHAPAKAAPKPAPKSASSPASKPAPRPGAPRITPAGDPSVASDTIYKLAVDPAEHPEEAVVWLLDDGVVRYEADGRGVRTFRQVAQVLKESAVEGYAEHEFSWAPGHQKLTVNWVRVVRPNGQVVSTKPAQTQDSDVPAEMGDPVYSDRRVRRISLSGVAPGTIVDYSYTVEELKPYLKGDFDESWAVTSGVFARRSRFLVDLPAAMKATIIETNLDFAPKVDTVGDRVVRTWARADVPRIKGEPFAADSNGVVQHIDVVGPTTWNDVTAWFAGLSKGRDAVGPAFARKIDSLVAGAKTRDDTVRAVHRWVAQDVRYVSLSLGIGGFQPRLPDTVYATGLGDCKDKATVFVAAMRRLGITAYPVLLSSTAGADRRLPTIGQFDHAIAAVQRADGAGYTFVDLTAEHVPYGELPYAEQGGFALVVHPDGTHEEVTLPKAPVDANVLTTRIVGTLSPDGTFDGRYEEAGRGARQYVLRDAFSQPFDSTQKANFLRTIAQNVFDGATGDSLVAFPGKDLAAEPKVSVVVRGGRAVTSTGGMQLLTLPFGNMANMGNVAAQLAAQPPRRFPIDAEAVIGGSASESELRVTLPEGWKARLPQGVSASSPFGSYVSEYAQDGRVLVVHRRVTGARGVLPPDRMPELIAWLQALSKDDAKFIVLERGS